MKTLQAFWHWIDNDKPANPTAKRDKLSKVALSALLHAESEVAARAFGPDRENSFSVWLDVWAMCCSGDGSNPNGPSERPEFFRPELIKAVRDLSLAICPALEAMHEAVQEPVPAPKPAPDFKREYLADWVPRPLNFTGRMLLWRDMQEPQPIVLHPDTYAKLQEELERPADVYEERAQALVAIDQGIAEQKRRDWTTRLQQEAAQRTPMRFPDLGDQLTARVKVSDDARGLLEELKALPLPRSDDLPDDEREYSSPEVRCMNQRLTARGFELTLTPAWVRYADWNSLRGLKPDHITMRGSAAEWGALEGVWLSFKERILDVLVAGGAELHFG